MTLWRSRVPRERDGTKVKVRKLWLGREKKKAKAVRTGTADVVLGRSKIAVPDPEELRRKRIEAAVACGRVVKTLSIPSTRQTCPTTAVGESSEENMHAELVTGGLEIHSHSPSPVQGIPAASAGMIH